MDDVEIVAVCDADSSKAEAFQTEFGVGKVFNRAKEMLERTPLDFVDIVTQPESHVEMVQLAAKYRISAICQKPLTFIPKEAREVVALCQQRNVPLMVHENFRWQSPMRAVKKASKQIGNLFFGRICFRSPYDVYVNQPYLAEAPRFIIADLGVHLLDLARFFMGEATELTCVTQQVNPNIKGEDSATILLKMESGAACVVDLSFASSADPDPFPQTFVHLEGSQGTVTLDDDYKLTVVLDGVAKKRSVNPIPLPWSCPPFHVIQESVLNTQKHWLECAKAKRTPETSGEDNLKTLELVFGAYKSAERGVVYPVKKTL